MILICSAAYITPELASEIGFVPPVFLPVGNKRLYQQQIYTLRKSFGDEPIYISIPADYTISWIDSITLDKMGVGLLYVPSDLSLSESVHFALNKLDAKPSCLRLLYGDTLLHEYPVTLDVLAVANSRDEYPWELDLKSRDIPSVWCGFFSFSKISHLLHCLISHKQSFIEAVKSYEDVMDMEHYFSDKWLDFGHVSTYFKSRSSITTERFFNTINIINGVVNKTSIDQTKIRAEINWFTNIPSTIKKYVPQMIDYGTNDHIASEPMVYYQIEYLPFLPLNEIYVYGKNKQYFWSKISDLMQLFLLEMYSSKALSRNDKLYVSNCFDDLIVKKTRLRFESFLKSRSYSDVISIKLNNLPYVNIWDVVYECQTAISNLPELPSVVHGDLCFSNILYNSRMDSIKVIDPRGMDSNGNPTIFGDLKYDLAKIQHSVLGFYDHIIANQFHIEFDDSNSTIDQTTIISKFDLMLGDHISDNDELFNGCYRPFGLKSSDILPLTILLFISMLPLHSDNRNRQDALLSNAIRLYFHWINSI